METNDETKIWNQSYLDKINLCFIKRIEEHKAAYNNQKKKFLTTKIKPYNEIIGDEKEYSFLKQLYVYFNLLSQSKNDEEVHEKLLKLGIPNQLLIHCVDINKIVFEINELSKKNGFIPINFALLDNGISISYLNFVNKFFEYYLLEQQNQLKIIKDANHTNKKFSRYSNSTQKDKLKLLDKFKLHELLTLIKFELLTFNFKENMNEIIINNNSFVTNVKENLDCLKNSFFVYGISMNKLYTELFPLLKSFITYKELLDERTFIERAGAEYNFDYNLYKLSRVKKILRIT